jgi:hypothetical protein
VGRGTRDGRPETGGESRTGDGKSEDLEELEVLEVLEYLDELEVKSEK